MGPDLTVHRVVIDSWPVMEWIKGREPARTYFNELIDDVVNGLSVMEMSRINYGEVIYTIHKIPGVLNREEAIRNFLSAPIRVHSVDDNLVDEAVKLKSAYPFSYADAFAAALAIRLRVPLITGDLEFRAVEADGLISLEWVGA
jgi:predicted nucleic acid-binding protein